MIRVITLNLNGIRSAVRKGWVDWVAAQQADIVCVQEVKAQLDDLDDAMRRVADMPGHFHCAQKKGYSGVALYSRHAPKSVRCGFGSIEFDDEGRYVEVDLGAFTVISVYVPSGSSSEERQAAKFLRLSISDFTAGGALAGIRADQSRMSTGTGNSTSARDGLRRR